MATLVDIVCGLGRRNRVGKSFLIVGILAATTVATFWYVFRDLRQLHWLGQGDGHAEWGAAAFLMDYSIHHGELPLWNPLNFCGTPHAAHPLRSTFYPPHLLRSLLTFDPTPLKTHIGLAILAYLHFALGGVAMFSLARRHALSPPASLAATFVFVYGSSAVYRFTGHLLFNMTLAWMPILLLILTYAQETPRIWEKIRRGTAAGLIFGFITLLGVPQLIVTVAFAAGAYCILYRCVRLGSRNSEGGNPPLRRLITGDVLVFSLMLGCAGLIAAVQLLPSAEFASFSSRGTPSGISLFTRGKEMPAWNFFQLLVTYSGSANIEGLRFAGVGALLLAVAAVGHHRRRDIVLFAALFYVLVDCSLGKPFPFASLLYMVSPFEMSSPPRAVMLACLPLAMLAGFGVDAVTTRGKTRSRDFCRAALLIASGVPMLLTLNSCVSPHPFLAVTKIVVAIPLTTLLIAVLAHWVGWSQVCRALLACLVFAETWVWNAHLIPTYYERNGKVKEYPGDFEFLSRQRQFWSDNRRGTEKACNWNLYDLRPAINGTDPLYLYRVWRVLCHPLVEDSYRRHITAEETTSANTRGNLFLKRAFWLAKEYVRGALPPKIGLFPSATTVFLPDPPDNLPIPEVRRADLRQSALSSNVSVGRVPLGNPLYRLKRDPSDPNTCLLEFPGIGNQPRGHSVLYLNLRNTEADSYLHPFFADPSSGRFEHGRSFRVSPAWTGKELHVEIPLPDFDQLQVTIRFNFQRPGGTVDILDASLCLDLEDEDSHINVRSRTLNSVDVELIDLPGYRVLTFIDAYYPGWKAYLDNAPVPILLANDVFKAVVVPPGTHSVRFVFRPWRLYTGFAISTVSLVTALFIVLWKRYPLAVQGGGGHLSTRQ